MAAQGQSFFVAAGDSDKWTKSNYPYPAEDANVITVGGTDLTTSSAGGPWRSETGWADGGGGISPDNIAIPSWQQLSGVITSANKGSTVYRNGPDVSANANFTFYVCADQTTCTANEYGGTSFAAPMWAGYVALANQQAAANGDSAVGFLNPTIYPIGLSSSYGTDFHDITSGNNGFAAVTGYDLDSGWGSPNGANLINALAPTSATPNFTISASPTSVSVAQGSSGTSTITSNFVNGFASAVALTASGVPTGVTASFSPTSITSSGGTSTLTLQVASTTATGTYTITVTGTSGTLTHTTTVALTVTASASANFALSASPTSLTVVRGNSGTSTITSTVSGGFNSAVALSAKGQPSSVTVSFSPTSIAAPGSGTSTMTVKTSTRTTGTYTITITGKGGGKTNTTKVSLTIQR
jgi:kumamolisin